MNILNNQPPRLIKFRSTALTKAATDVNTGTCNLYGFNCINNNAAPIYIKFYDQSAASVAAGSSLPVLTLLIQGDTGPKPGSLLLRGSDLPFHFSNGCSVRCCTGFADTDDTDASTPPILEIVTTGP